MSKAPTSALELFDHLLPNLLRDHAQKAKEMGGVYAFELGGEGGGHWTIDLTAEPPKVIKGLQPDAQCSIVMDHSDFVQLLVDRSMATTLFLKGKLKVKGNPMQALKIQKLLSWSAA